MIKKETVFGALRIGMGWIFLWPFLDKAFGLGFATCRDAQTKAVSIMCERAWLSGGSPTTGFLTSATRGPFADVFQSLAGNPFVDWLFMLGLLGIGVALIFGILTRIATWSGVAMLLLMYLALLPPANNPIIDDHIIYSLILIGLYLLPSEKWLGFGKKWAKTTKRNPWLK